MNSNGVRGNRVCTHATGGDAAEVLLIEVSWMCAQARQLRQALLVYS